MDINKRIKENREALDKYAEWLESKKNIGRANYFSIGMELAQIKSICYMCMAAIPDNEELISLDKEISSIIGKFKNKAIAEDICPNK